MKTVVRARAKINLSLDVVGKRRDGYHNLKSIMQSVSLFDTVALDTGGEGIRVSTDCSFLPTDNRNTAHKAASLFYEKTGLPKGISIHIKKTIPTGAGLGGGSADGAAVLLGMNALYDNPLGQKELLALGLACGADVPFCMTGGTCLAEGVGEVLTPLPLMPDCIILIAKPSASLSTRAVFKSFSMKSVRLRPDTEGIIKCLEKGDVREIAVRMYNVLEDAVKPRYRALDEYKSVMRGEGAQGAAMTGSGSAVFGIFTDENAAKKAKRRLECMNLQVFITKPEA